MYPSFIVFMNANANKFIPIPEHAIESASEMMASLYPDQVNSFTSIKQKIAIFKEAQMTPLVLMDPTNYTVYVVSEETFQKKLH